MRRKRSLHQYKNRYMKIGNRSTKNVTHSPRPGIDIVDRVDHTQRFSNKRRVSQSRCLGHTLVYSHTPIKLTDVHSNIHRDSTVLD